MPFHERTVETMREEFVKRVLGGEKTKAALCREYGISRPTGDKWIARHLAGKSLSDRPKTAHSNPRWVAPAMEERIVGIRKQHPAIGAIKIVRMLQDDHVPNVPCVRTANNILLRHGLITAEASAAVKPYQRFEKSYPNEMWQADFKGHFGLKSGQRCHPLNIEDDCSRWNICSKAQETETLEETKPNIIAAFEAYGLPFSFLCDNGNPWGTAQTRGFTALEVWMMELGILVLHGRIRHPQTQGKMERFNRSMKDELLKYCTMDNFEDAQEKMSEYRDFYNNKRPHHALNLDTPAQHYHPSQREYSDVISRWEYPQGHTICSVHSNGFFRYKRQAYFLSEGFKGKEIGVRPSRKEGCVTLCFREFRIGRINLETKTYDFKCAYLAEGDPRTKNQSYTDTAVSVAPCSGE